MMISEFNWKGGRGRGHIYRWHQRIIHLLPLTQVIGSCFAQFSKYDEYIFLCLTDYETDTIL